MYFVFKLLKYLLICSKINYIINHFDCVYETLKKYPKQGNPYEG